MQHPLTRIAIGVVAPGVFTVLSFLCAALVATSLNLSLVDVRGTLEYGLWWGAFGSILLATSIAIEPKLSKLLSTMVLLAILWAAVTGLCFFISVSFLLLSASA